MRTRTTLALASIVFLVVAAAFGAQSTDQSYGESFTLEEITPLAEIMATPGKYLGTEVRTAGYIYLMCEDMGCWLGVLPSLDSGKMVKISFTQAEVVFPIGEETTTHYVELQGEVISAEQEAEEHAEHMAEEGEDPAAHAEEHAEHMAPEMRTIYVCPTDTGVMSASPGACPTGGAKLVAKEIPVPEFIPLAINGRAAVVKAKK